MQGLYSTGEVCRGGYSGLWLSKHRHFLGYCDIRTEMSAAASIAHIYRLIGISPELPAPALGTAPCCMCCDMLFSDTSDGICEYILMHHMNCVLKSTDEHVRKQEGDRRLSLDVQREMSVSSTTPFFPFQFANWCALQEQ